MKKIILRGVLYLFLFICIWIFTLFTPFRKYIEINWNASTKLRLFILFLLLFIALLVYVLTKMKIKKRCLFLFLFSFLGGLIFLTISSGQYNPLEWDMFLIVFLVSFAFQAFAVSVNYAFLIRNYNINNKFSPLTIIGVYFASIVLTYSFGVAILLSSLSLSLLPPSEGLFEAAFIVIHLIEVPIFIFVFSIIPFLLTIWIHRKFYQVINKN